MLKSKFMTCPLSLLYLLDKVVQHNIIIISSVALFLLYVLCFVLLDRAK